MHPGVARERDRGPERENARDAQPHALAGAAAQVAPGRVGDAQAQQAQRGIGADVDRVRQRAQVQHC